MARKEHTDDEEHTARVQAVLELLRQQAPLSVKQVNFCNYACIELFLKSRGDNVKKAVKQLRACLSWRESIGTEHMIADEFSAELAEGVAYVAGNDDESKPVVIFRIKQDNQKFHSRKSFTRLLVFTLEVAVSAMPENVEQFVLLFDASFYRSASAFMNLFLAALKIVGEYYPGRLYKAFVIDPPPLFSYLWKGLRPFVQLSTVTMVVSSLDFEGALDSDDFTAYQRASSLRFDPLIVKSTTKIGSCSSSRFSFTVPHHCDSLKPWYLSLTDTSASTVDPMEPPSAPISPLNTRSLSFASPVARTPVSTINGGSCLRPTRRSMFPSTPARENSEQQKRTPRPSFLQSSGMFFRKESHVTRTEKSRESFIPFLKFYRSPYDETTYRSKMKPSLGGLISIVSPQVRRRHVSVSQRF